MRQKHVSVARQLLLVQALLLVFVVTAAAVVGVLVARNRADRNARADVLGVARSLAANPFVAEQATTRDPTTALEPYAENVRRASGLDFVVIMSPDRTRWTHPDVTQIGRPFIGTIAPALQGRAFVETYVGTLGRSVRAVAPVRAANGDIVALVAVGITTGTIHSQLVRQLPFLLLALAVLLLIALAGSLWVGRRLRRQTRGMDAHAISQLYSAQDAVLHSVREGLIVVDDRGRLSLVNDEAGRLLGLRSEDVGQPVATLELPATIRQLLVDARSASDELHLTEDRIVVINQSVVKWDGRDAGTVTTMRDRTELESLSGELDTARAFAESLRSQAHEAANRLHTVVVLVETAQYEQAVRYATDELELSQRLTDRIMNSINEPVLAALLLGKAAQAAERGVELVVGEGSSTPESAFPISDLVTILGNLLDNAIDATADAALGGRREVELTIRAEHGDLLLQVADDGPGLLPEMVESAFTRGWSTKVAATSAGRGLGLALVQQVVRRHQGSISVDRRGSISVDRRGSISVDRRGSISVDRRGQTGGAVFTVRLPLPLRAARAAEDELTAEAAAIR